MIAITRNAQNEIRNRRAGYTLLELIISSGAASIVLLGLMSSIVIANKAWDPALDPVQQLQASEAAHQIANDARFALSFTERTSNALTITVPDRDSDGQPETVRYAWSGSAGDPLTVEYNGQSAQTLISNVQTLNLAYLTRDVTGSIVP
jgi:hypothetical protein